MGLADDAPEGSTVEPYDDGQYIGQKYTFERQPLSEASGDELSITREGNNFVVDGELDLSDEELTETPELAESFSIKYAITVPGEVIAYLIENDSRAEEHTSELQSRGNPVCRLLREQNK